MPPPEALVASRQADAPPSRKPRKPRARRVIPRDPARMAPLRSAICGAIDRGALHQHSGHTHGFCAIGAAVGRCVPIKFAEAFQVPVWVASHVDLIFDNLPGKRAQSWPLEVALAIAATPPNPLDLRVVLAQRLIEQLHALPDGPPEIQSNYDRLAEAIKTPLIHRQWATEVYINATLKMMKSHRYSGDIRALAMFRAGLRTAQWLDSPTGCEDLLARVALMSQSMGAIAAWEQQADCLLQALSAHPI